MWVWPAAWDRDGRSGHLVGGETIAEGAARRRRAMSWRWWSVVGSGCWEGEGVQALTSLRTTDLGALGGCRGRHGPRWRCAPTSKNPLHKQVEVDLPFERGGAGLLFRSESCPRYQPTTLRDSVAVTAVRRRVGAEFMFG